VEFSNLIAARKSTRAFSDRAVEPAKIERMLEAARWSPSSANKQPWRFVVVEREDPSRPALEEALDPGNGWARKAPVLIVSGGRKGLGGGVESREYHLHDAGLALMSLLYRGTDQGLLVHPMAGWREAPLRTALSLPDDFVPIAVTAVGYPGRPADLDEATRKKDERPRVRKEPGEIAFRGRWGEPFRGSLPRGPAKVFEADLPLRFRDIDALGHVNNAVFMTLFETARILFSIHVMGAKGVGEIDFILAEATCRYRKPILLTDKVRARMYVTDVARSSFRYKCQLVNPDNGDVFADAETVQVAYDYAGGRVRPLGPEFLEKVREYIGG
jgi:YbgC/YbaW family acyl-CoA thioester hydrolase